MEKDKIGQELTKEEIENTLKELEGIDVDTTGNTIDGEYKEYGFEIDEENRVIVGNKIKGEKPTGVVVIVTKEEGVETVKLQVLVEKPKDGSIIEIIEAVDKEKVKAIEDSTNGSLSQMFEVSDNGYFTFRIKSSNRKKC